MIMKTALRREQGPRQGNCLNVTKQDESLGLETRIYWSVIYVHTKPSD